MSNGIHVLLAAAGEGAACDELVSAMKAEQWQVTEASSAREAAALAAGGVYHLAVIACQEASELPAEAVRSLMSLQADTAVIFLAKDPAAAARCGALAWATADQIYPLGAGANELVSSLRKELADVDQEVAEYTIYCVDDDEEFLASLKGFLPLRLAGACGRFDLDFEFFSNPLDALAEAQDLPANRLAVVIADQIMPQVDGIELLKRIKALHGDTRCVLLTGHAALETAVMGINSRVLEKYLLKPIEEPVGFVRSIEDLVRQHHLVLQSSIQRLRVMDQFEFIRSLSAAADEEAALASASIFLQERVGATWVVGALRTEDGYAVKTSLGSTGRALVGTTLGGDGPLERMVQGGSGAGGGPGDGAWGQFLPWPRTLLPLSWGARVLGFLLAGRGDGGRAFTRAERRLMAFVRDVTSVAVGGWRDRHAVEETYVGTMAALMETIEAKDGYTRGHTERVTHLAAALAEALGMGGEEMQDLRRAAKLHDIGKIAVPDAIILKPGRLDAEELRVIRDHPSRGDKILSPLKYLSVARMIVRSHHERYDGKGYPDGLAAEEIPLGARILAIADSYDAMTSTRTYRPAMAPAAALHEIEINAGRQFDPRLAATFVKMMKRGPEPAPAAPLATAAANQESKP